MTLMTPNGPKMAKNDPKWPKMTQMIQNGPKMAKNDLKWPKMNQNGPKMAQQ